MRRWTKYSLATCGLAALVSALSCVTGKSEEASPKNAAPAADQGAKKDSGRVEPALSAELAERLAKAGPEVIAAYGLFSEGGWSNAGQVMVLYGKDVKSTRVLLVAPNQRQIGTERPATEAEWRALAQAVAKAAPLADVDQKAFDALAIEYVSYTRGGGGAQRAAHWFYCNPGGKPSPDHEAVITAFQSLRPAPKPPKK